MKPVVAVLLSTYNGEKYLKEQIDSVLAQKDVEVRIIIRDDGSHDSTIDILKDYQLTFPSIKCLFEDNVGAEMSFHCLCQFAKDNIIADYYAFCDQDDVWETDKLKVAIKRLSSCPHAWPCLYFSNLQMVDSHLQPIRQLFASGEVVISKQMALIQVFTYGCTCVFNRSALVSYCKADFSKELAHDNWIYILCMYLGNVYYDNESHILYRQHGANISGAKVTGYKLFFKRLRRGAAGHWGNDFELYSTMLLKCFAESINLDDKMYVERIATYRKNYLAKIALLFSPNYRTGSFLKDIAIKIRILTNHL